MANKPQLKAVGEQDFSESDPFAELTRIMGFDPRVQPTPRPEDDFQIDLEKELMGEFGDANERDDAPRQADSLGVAHRVASPMEATEPVDPAAPSPPAEDLETALTSVFQQELGEESDAYASSAEASDETGFLPHEQETAATAEDPHFFPIEGKSETDNFDLASSPFEPASVEMGEVEAVEDKGPELAESLNQLLSDAGYRSGSSYSGAAQVYQISASYVTAPPAAEPPASNETPADEPAPITSENPEQAQSSTQHRSTVFGTTPPQWDGGISAPSEPAGSDIPSAFDAPFDEMETDNAAYHELADGFGAKSSSESEDVRGPEDPFAALAALGGEQSSRSFREETPAPAPAPVSDRPVGESRRFEGAARFYSSLDLFSRATPVAPGMRQPPRVAEPAPLPEQEMPEPAQELSFAAGEEETAFAEPVWAREDEPDLTGPDEAYGDVPAEARETEMRGEAAPAAEAGAQPGSPAHAMPQASAFGSGIDRGQARAAPDSMPEIETVDVAEPAVAITDDLDIPTPPVEETPPPAPAFDDLDQEFATVFSDMRHKEAKAAAQPAIQNEDEELTAKIEELFSAEEFDFSEHESPARAAAAIAANASTPTRIPAQGAYAPEAYAFRDEYYDAGAASAYAEMPEETPAYHPSLPLALLRRRRALVVDVVIGCVFVAIAVGVFAYTHHSAKDNGPVLLKADAHPVKMKPKHPGGTKVPNQDNQVYKRVADGDVAQPVQQQKLVSSQEKPVDLSAQAKSDAASVSPLPGVDMPKIRQASSQEIAALAKSDANQQQKNQDRVAPSSATGADTSRADDVIAVVPRKVRTMIVKPDGTMVPTPLPAATPAAAPKSVAAAALEDPAAKAPAGGKSAAAAEHLQQPASNGTVVTPEHVDIAPSRPPVQQVSAKEPARNEPASNEKVASLGAAPAHPAAAAAAAGWAMQIASQPSAQAAQASYQHLAHRYGNVLGGHGVDIVKAEIAGKGTYYRVRVPSSSRDEAIALCTKYKAAGGNCFVSK